MTVHPPPPPGEGLSSRFEAALVSGQPPPRAAEAQGLPRAGRGREGTLRYYSALIEAYTAPGRTPLVDELDRVVTELEGLAAGGA